MNVGISLKASFFPFNHWLTPDDDHARHSCRLPLRDRPRLTHNARIACSNAYINGSDHVQTRPTIGCWKAAIANNHLSHGLLAAAIVLPTESAADWERFHDDVGARLDAEGPVETALASRVAESSGAFVASPSRRSNPSP